MLVKAKYFLWNTANCLDFDHVVYYQWSNFKDKFYRFYTGLVIRILVWERIFKEELSYIQGTLDKIDMISC